jgi:uncharacterized coiled-coil protein SlyX
VDTQTDGKSVPSRPEQAPSARVRWGVRLRRRFARPRQGAARAADPRWERRAEALETRLAHLESAHEGLQDAVYRQAILEDQKVEVLRRRLEPGQLARDLSDNARRCGL